MIQNRTCFAVSKNQYGPEVELNLDPNLADSTSQGRDRHRSNKYTRVRSTTQVSESTPGALLSRNADTLERKPFDPKMPIGNRYNIYPTVEDALDVGSRPREQQQQPFEVAEGKRLRRYYHIA